MGLMCDICRKNPIFDFRNPFYLDHFPFFDAGGKVNNNIGDWNRGKFQD